MPDALLDRVVAAVGDRYEIEAELGRGGMAVVYRAVDVRLRRRLALKVLPPDLAFRADVRTRFLREAQTAAGLTHPNIVPVYSADEAGGLVYLAMALVDGESLAARLSREPCPPLAFVRRVVGEVADALAYAHEHGVVHRDVKPDNILLDGQGRAVVTDFGIARAAEADSRLTVTGVAVGTPAYMSPEQALGEREVDGRSDLYSLGIVAYQMLAGVLPFTSSNTAGMLMKHVGEKPRPIATHRRDVPPAMAAAVERALAKSPEERWRDVAEFRRAFLGAGDQVAAVVPAAAPIRAPAPVARAVAVPPAGRVPDWRDEQRDWRAHLEEQRRAWREQQQAQRDEWREQMRQWGPPHRGPAALPQPSAALPVERRAEIFRRNLLASATGVAFLAFINLATVPWVPWVIFPAIGMAGGIRRRWRPLRDEGLHFWDVALGRSVSANGTPPKGPAAARPASMQSRAEVESTVSRFRTRFTVAAASLGGSATSFAIGTSTGEDALIFPFVSLGVLSLGAAVSAMRQGSKLRRAGVRLRDALSNTWKQAVASADRRPRQVIVAEEAGRLVPDAVIAGPYGAVVRTAVDDRMTVRETVARLAPEDRALIPEIEPTVDSLVQRVATLAQSLHRLDGDVSPELLAQLDTRIGTTEGEPASAPDRERKLSLLRRQRATLADLADRRATLAGQLESATLVLQNIRLDLVKLRSAGVGATIADVSSATREARALSRDIAHVLEAAEEVRSV